MEKDILTPDATAFLEDLHRTFNPKRLKLLKVREELQKKIDNGEKPDFISSIKGMHSNLDWRVADTPKDLQKRWVEITGPTDRKMMINALNSDADVFMADFEDANSPTWQNMIEGQQNCRDAVRKTISLKTGDKEYALNEKIATLVVRPRGWHLEEKHFQVDGENISASLFDFGLYFFHNAKMLLANESGPYFYLPKLQNHKEARLWNEVFLHAQKSMGIARGTIRATVLIEHILAAFEMEEILFELREHSSGLNAGRWDYIFSMIKTFRGDPEFLLPDRKMITMEVPFMHAYAELLVMICHKRYAHAIGGMAAFIPNRKDPEVTEMALKKVREDKIREVNDGFDGTWIAHPDLLTVVIDIFEKHLKGKPHQKKRMRNDVQMEKKNLLNTKIEGAGITEEGVRTNVSVALQYLASWLDGRGAVAIDNLMEDAATAEISRAQLWQWFFQNVSLSNGDKLTKEKLQSIIEEERGKLGNAHKDLFDQAEKLLSDLVFTEHFIEFLTWPGYKLLNGK